MTASTRAYLSELRTWLFDLDGVLTNSAVAHAVAWKASFDEFLAANDPAQPPFDQDGDYLTYVDGRPRDDGIRTFLASRSIAPDDDAVRALGDRTTERFRAAVDAGQVSVYPDAVVLLDGLAARGARCAVVSSSANAELVLVRTGLRPRFACVVDGVTIVRDGLAGKPAPDTFLAAAAQLGAAPRDAVVLEDATVGVRAGHVGGFGLVVGVDRTGSREALLGSGADITTTDLGSLLVIEDADRDQGAS